MLSIMSEETVAPPSSVKLFGKTIVSSEDTNDSSSSSVVTKVSDHNEKNSGILLKGSEEDEEENKTLQGKSFSSSFVSEPDKKRNTVLATVSSKNYVDMRNSGILKKGFDENSMENKSLQGKAISSSSVSEEPMKRNTVLSPVSSKSYGCMKNSQIPMKGFDEVDMENKPLQEKIASSSSVSEVPKKRSTVFSAVSSKNSLDMKNSQVLDKGFEKDPMENKTIQGKLISSSSTSEPPKKPNTVLPCPRCDSTDTKFCYYNNYNVNQPRHFCRNCQRYWTAGGLLRNVPIGSGRRKNKHPGREDLVGSPRVFGNNHDCVSSEDSGKIGDNGVENEEIIASEKRDFAENVVKEERKEEEQLPCCGNGVSQMWPFYYGGFYGNLPYPFMMGPEGGIKSNVGDFVTQSLPWLQQVPGTNPLPIPQNFYPGYPWTVPQLSWYHPSSPWGLPLMPGVLGKHGREEDDSNADSPNGDVVVDSKCRNDGSLWVPKTLRIDDPGEAAKSSIWSTFGTGNKSDSITSGGIFKAFHPKVEQGEKIATKDNEQVLCANPAASSRSASFKENT